MRQQQHPARSAMALAASAALVALALPAAPTSVYKAHARHWNALDQARAHARRTVNSLALAGKDLDAAGGTDHRERLAAHTLTARALATV